MTNPAPESPATLARSGRRAWGALESLHVLAFLSTEVVEAYRGLDLLHGRSGYIAARSAPLGKVPSALVTATFYVFAPAGVDRALPSSWDVIGPEEILAVRLDATERALRRVLGELANLPAVEEAADLARAACAGLGPHGRPLYAAHTAVPWPDGPLMTLWHAAGLLREHRGDGHIAALVQHDLGPVEALVINGIASGSTDFVRTTRGWTEAEWQRGTDRLVARGLLDPAGALTAAGLDLQRAVEQATDRAAVSGWQALGAFGTERLIELLTPLRSAVAASGALPAWVTARG